MRSSTLLLKNVTARALLALAFLFGQQAAAQHWLSHAVEATRAKTGKAAPTDHCDQCLAMAGLGAGAPSQGPVLPLPTLRHALLATYAAVDAPASTRLAFRSRAPPVLT